MSAVVESHPRFLVTGSTGFIGRRLVDRLVSEAGARSVACLVKAPSTPLEARALERQRACGVRMIEGDLLAEPISTERPPVSTVLFHLAANVDTSANEQQLRVNDEGTERLLRWLRSTGPRLRVVYTSSVAVHDRESRPIAPITEESPCVPRTAYGRTKLRGEAVVRAYGASGNGSWTILRLPTVYGPGQKANGLFETLASMVVRRAWAGRLDWPGRTSIIHVDDAVDAMIDLGLRPEAAGHVFGIASDESLTVGEIARHVAEALETSHAPISLSPSVWNLAQSVVWNRAFQALVPHSAHQVCWRLSLVLSDGFWIDTTKFRGVYSKPLRSLPQGLADVPLRVAPECLGPAGSP